MSEDFWFIKAALAVIFVLVFVLDIALATGFLSQSGLAIAALILALDARRDRARDFWHSDHI